jgi:AbrB family looped-hinge helix DNA binding protein
LTILESKDFRFFKEKQFFFEDSEEYVMELAKISTRGQITLPLSIRRRLGLSDGDKVVFWEENGHVVVENALTVKLTISPEPQARRILAPGDQKRQSRKDAIRKIRNLRARCEPVTVDEILAWRDEGRP